MKEKLNSGKSKAGWQEMHDLIRSLTPNEKGYFRKYSTGFSAGSSHTYLKLFSILEKQEVLNDKQIKNQMGRDVNIHSMRKFLYNQVLRSLRAYHKGKNSQYKLREMMDYAEILSDKGLFEQSQQFITKGIEMSDPVTFPAYQILFQTQQIQMLRFFNEEEKIKKTDEIVHSITESAEIIKHAYITRQGLTKALYYVNTYFPLRDVSVKEDVNKLLEELKAVPDTAKQNYRMRNTRNAAISLLYRLLSDWDQAIIYQEKTIRIMEDMDAQILNRNLPVISAYYNYLSLFLNKGDDDAYEKQMQKMMVLPVSGKSEERYLKALIIQLHLDHLIFSKQFLKPADVINDAEIFLKEPHPIPGIYHDTLMRLAAWYIFTKDFSAAQEKINMLLQTAFVHTLRSFPLHVRLMHILVHYELNNTLLLPSLIRNTYRFMMKQELAFEIEKTILNFFRRVLNHINQNDLQREFKNLSRQLNKAAEDKYEQQALKSFFDYRHWIEIKTN